VQGHYGFTINTAVGANALRVVATDGFGQQSSAALTVTRVVDSHNPDLLPQVGSTFSYGYLYLRQAGSSPGSAGMVYERLDFALVALVKVDENLGPDGRLTETLTLDYGAVLERLAQVGADGTIKITTPPGSWGQVTNVNSPNMPSTPASPTTTPTTTAG